MTCPRSHRGYMDKVRNHMQDLGPQSLHLQTPYDMGICRAAVELIHRKQLKQCLVHREHSIMLAIISITNWKVKDILGTSCHHEVLAECLEMRYFRKLEVLEEGEAR